MAKRSALIVISRTQFELDKNSRECFIFYSISNNCSRMLSPCVCICRIEQNKLTNSIFVFILFSLPLPPPRPLTLSLYISVVAANNRSSSKIENSERTHRVYDVFIFELSPHISTFFFARSTVDVWFICELASSTLSYLHRNRYKLSRIYGFILALSQYPQLSIAQFTRSAHCITAQNVHLNVCSMYALIWRLTFRNIPSIVS